MKIAFRKYEAAATQGRLWGLFRDDLYSWEWHLWLGKYVLIVHFCLGHQIKKLLAEARQNAAKRRGGNSEEHLQQ
jgi:hypothetical protein